jgi:hypothetical protein
MNPKFTQPACDSAETAASESQIPFLLPIEISTMRIQRFCLAIALTLSLAACAGTNFKRPTPGALDLGRSTSTQVTQLMGTPAQTGELLRNGEKLRVVRYAYAEGAGAGKYPGVTPARAIAFFFHNDVLVAEEFVSSFPVDATDFDESKIPSIVKGKTTMDELTALLGRPTGNAVYPFIKNKGERAVLYSYTHVKGAPFNMRMYLKSLAVSFDSSGVVSEIEYTSSGEK